MGDRLLIIKRCVEMSEGPLRLLDACPCVTSCGNSADD